MSVKRKIGIVLAVGCVYIVVKDMINVPDTRTTSTQPVEVDPVKQAVWRVWRSGRLKQNGLPSWSPSPHSILPKRTARIPTQQSRADLQSTGFKVMDMVKSINTNIRGKPYITMKGRVNTAQGPQYGIAEKWTVQYTPQPHS